MLVVAAVVLTTVSVHGPRTDSRLIDQAHPPPSGHPTDQQLWGWALTLPVGEPAHVSYGFQDRVWSEGHTITFPAGLDITLEGPLRGGWFARVDHPTGGGHDIRYAFVGVDGSIRYFADHLEHRHGVVTGYAASPDGSRVIYKGFVVDVATGRIVDRLPRSTYLVMAWTEQGVEYLGRPGIGFGVFLWQPGRSPVRLPVDELYSPDLVVKYGDRCQQGLLVEDGSVRPLRSACGSFGYSKLATSHRFVVMSDGRLVARDGRETAGFPVPHHAPQPPGFFPHQGAVCCGLVWEDDRHLLVTMQRFPDHATMTSAAARLLAVRCTVEATGLECERAASGPEDIDRIAIRPPLTTD